MEVNLCDDNANDLAAYLADHGARNYRVMVVIAQPFGRVFEIWNHDMGLGPVEPQFIAVNEEDVGLGVVQDADVLENVEDAEAEVQDQVPGASPQMNEDGEPAEVVEIQE